MTTQSGGDHTQELILDGESSCRSHESARLSALTSECISVAICTCNGERFLREQLDSILNQTLLPDEIVVCDDVSKDNTLRILSESAGQSRVPFQITQNPVNLGSTQNFSNAISKCRGGLIVLADQDDRWRPGKLATISGVFQRHPETDLVFSDANLIDGFGHHQDGRLWEAAGFRPHVLELALQQGYWRVLLRRYVVTGATMAFRSTWRDRLLPIPDSWVHDAWISLMIAAAGGSIRAIPEPLIDYRLHPAQQLGVEKRNSWQQFQHSRGISAEHFLRESSRYQAAAERIAELTDRSHPAVQDLSSKQQHLQARAAGRVQGLRGVPGLVREYLSGRYRLCSDGWKSFVTDLAVLTAGSRNPPCRRG